MSDFITTPLRDVSPTMGGQYSLSHSNKSTGRPQATAVVRDTGIAVLGALKELIVAVNTKRYKCSQSEQDTRLLELDRAPSALRTRHVTYTMRPSSTRPIVLQFIRR
ncbi:hypothetical protein OH76DRAFT_172302 [Lentinus brumalis]|uniref:Uncharacterized protein n=1 Tax=Lentinus brumalis TaxID=2498619 RepID=A0A371DJB3_9APHY|nr:hypothetical protein OH76DRAFT_172302 [Polyporus brumalis]